MATKVLDKKIFNSDTIKLVYWNKPNFGDILSPYIIGKLSGKKIAYKSGYLGKLKSFKRLIKYLLLFQFKNINSILFPWEKNLLGIGSIISCGNEHSTIWGSGFISEKENFHGGKILAVRGKFTNDKLSGMGFQGTTIWGDPALLIPLLIKPAELKTYSIGIIPHWSEVDFFKKKYGNDFKIIDLRTRDIEHVIKEITSCEYVLSTSLHGIIVSHAYNIPTLWIKKQTLHADDIKFKDYFSSVNIPIYEGFTEIDNYFTSNHNWRNLFKENQDKYLPQVNIQTIQQNLLNCAPFKIVCEINN